MVRDILVLFDHDYQLISMAKKPLLLPIVHAYLLLLLPIDRHYHYAYLQILLMAVISVVRLRQQECKQTILTKELAIRL